MRLLLLILVLLGLWVTDVAQRDEAAPAPGVVALGEDGSPPPPLP